VRITPIDDVATTMSSARPVVALGLPLLLVAAPVPTGPSLEELTRLAGAHPDQAWPLDAHISTAHNAHYSNTRAQLAIALSGEYNSLEGDIRVRDGVAVMAHDSGRVPELTFEQWATLGARSGKMLRVDVKDAGALASVVDTLDRLRVPHERITFNLSVEQPWSGASVSMRAAKAVRHLFPAAWISLNRPLPGTLGIRAVIEAGQALGGKVAVAMRAPGVDPDDVRRARAGGITVNIWNLPLLWQPANVAAETARLRALGVNGQIDLRRRDDPLADD